MSVLPEVSRRRSALVNLAFHYSGLIFTLTYGIFLVPLYLKYVSVALYGAWLASGNVLAWLELADPGLASVLQQRVGQVYGRKDLTQLSRVIGTGILMSLGLALIPLAGWPFADELASLLDLQGEEAAILTHSFRIGLAALALTLASYAPTAVNLGLQRSMTAGLVYTAASVIGLGTTAALLLLGWGLPSLPLGMGVRAGLLFLGNLVTLGVWCLRHLPVLPRFDREELSQVAGISSFTFVSRIGGALLGRLDALMASQLVSTPAAAVLTLTGRAYEPVRLVGDRVGPALLPALSHLAGERGSGGVAAISTRAAHAVGWVAALGAGGVAALNHAFVALWVGPEFFGGRLLTAGLGLATAISIILGVTTQAVFAMGGIRRTSVVGLVEAAVKLPLQFALTPVLGLVAMPLSAILGSLSVSAWYIPRLSASMSGMTERSQFAPIVAGLRNTLLLTALGLAVGWSFDRLISQWTWAAFVGATLLTGATFSGVLWLLDPVLRREVGPLLQARWARLRGALAP